MVWERKQKGKENRRDLGLRQVLENRTGCMLHWHIESLHYVQPLMTLFRVTYLCSWSIQVDKWYQVMHSTLSNLGIPFNSKESADFVQIRPKRSSSQALAFFRYSQSPIFLGPGTNRAQSTGHVTSLALKGPYSDFPTCKTWSSWYKWRLNLVESTNN